MSFDITPTAAQDDQEFALAAGQKITLTLYNASGKGILPGSYALIQQEVATDVWSTVDVLTATKSSLVWEAEGSWRVLKLASDEAVGVLGVGGA